MCRLACVGARKHAMMETCTSHTGIYIYMLFDYLASSSVTVCDVAACMANFSAVPTPKHTDFCFMKHKHACHAEKLSEVGVFRGGGLLTKVQQRNRILNYWEIYERCNHSAAG